MLRLEHQSLGDVSVAVIWIETKDGCELAITRIQKKNPDKLSIPIILIHGSYSKRNFWISDKGVGMGKYLADQGFDVWIPELRGHGLSPKDDMFPKITAEDQIKYDLPAIQDFIYQKTQKSAFWIGHSFGGIFIICALSMKWMKQENVKGLVTFGSQISLGDRYLKIPPLVWTVSALLKMMGHFPAPKFGLGPEIESAGTILEIIRWKKLFGKWTDSEGVSYWDGLGDIQIPVLNYAAAIDKNDPPEGCKLMHDHFGSRDKIFIELSKDNRFSKNYDHVGMVVSREAKEEVWPDVLGWLSDRT